MGADGVAAFRRPVAPCPSCGESQHIEPLRRVGPFWFACKVFACLLDTRTLDGHIQELIYRPTLH